MSRRELLVTHTPLARLRGKVPGIRIGGCGRRFRQLVDAAAAALSLIAENRSNNNNIIIYI